MQLWVSLASEAACAAALQHAVAIYDIYDTETLQAVLQHDAAGLARAMCTALRAEAPSRSSTGTQTQAASASMGTQTVPDNVVDISTAEAMVAEALSMADEAQERERAADERARHWLASAELAAALLRKADARTDYAQVERQAAQTECSQLSRLRDRWRSTC